MTEARFGDVVWVRPPEGLRCVIPATGGMRKTEVPEAGMEVTVDLMILRLISHGDLVVFTPEAVPGVVKE